MPICYAAKYRCNISKNEVIIFSQCSWIPSRMQNQGSRLVNHIQLNNFVVWISASWYMNRVYNRCDIKENTDTADAAKEENIYNIIIYDIGYRKGNTILFSSRANNQNCEMISHVTSEAIFASKEYDLFQLIPYFII